MKKQSDGKSEFIDNRSMLTSAEQFNQFVQVFKNKDCTNLKKWLGDKLYYSFDEARFAFFSTGKIIFWNLKLS
ncbi:hypothetical protein [Leptospira limi]|uniref:Uncharacterized protein n=1 Tax=Leptospira limi TaxID=2950023 RepID=A0ABT3M370_9LEPT|nr:hypothetical protein [Leptospira limi]MCW7464012.1 hypothetical protein [Leptospira limi]